MTTLRPRNPSRGLRRTLLLATITATAIGGAPAVGLAAPSQYGSSSLTLDAGSRGLRTQGVRVVTVAPAKTTRARTRATLPVTSGTVRTTATVGLGGTVRLTRGKRRVTLTQLQLKLGRTSTLSGRIDGTRRTIGRIAVPKGRLKLDVAAGKVNLTQARLTLSRATAQAVKRRLALRRAPTARVATVVLQATLRDAPAPTVPGGSTGGGTTGGTGGGSGSGSGSGGSNCPAGICSKPITNEPPVLARPATAVPVTAATLTWRVRDSFIRYINSGTGTSVFGGAVAGAPETSAETSTPYVYTFDFPFANGWFDPASGTSGTYFQGGVRFLFPAHTIDMSAANPEIELNGSKSRAIFRFDGANGTAFGGKRGVLIDLDLSTPPTVSPDGRTRTYTKVPGRIPADAGESIFAGFYGTGEPFGWVTVTLTTP